MLTLIIYLVLALAAIGLWLYVNRAQKGGKQLPFLVWLRRGMTSVEPPRATTVKASAGSESLVDEVTVLLDDIYREFMEEANRVRQEAAVEIAKLRQDMAVQFAELQALRTALPTQVKQADTSAVAAKGTARTKRSGQSTAAEETDGSSISSLPSHGREPAASHPPAGTDVGVQGTDPSLDHGESVSVEIRYARILDELLKGEEPTEIARKLGTGVNEVELVRQLMTPQ